jgi:hypothetical protein
MQSLSELFEMGFYHLHFELCTIKFAWKCCKVFGFSCLQCSGEASDSLFLAIFQYWNEICCQEGYHFASNGGVSLHYGEPSG